jgi:Fic family protein
MDEQQFSPEQQRHLLRTVDGAWAFVPPPLPPKIDIGPVAIQLAAAAKAVGELNGAARRLQNPYMLITPLIRKEALTTSAMEGTITTIDNMLLQEIVPEAKKDDDAREAYNYVAAVRRTTEDMKTLPISGRLLKSAHEILLSGLSTSRGAGKRPGEYKKLQNAIGDPGDDIFTAKYVPPPPQQTPQCMAELEGYINRQDRKDGEELIDLALGHYQFEAIHPFQDGNGRIGRMLVTLMAMQMHLMELPLLHISATLEKDKPAYIEKLFAVSARGAWAEWISYFLGTVQASCKAATTIVDKAISLHAVLKSRALLNNKNHRLPSIIDDLFIKEWTTAAKAAALCGVSFPTAQSDIQQLVKLEILRPIPHTRPAIFVAQAIWDLSKRT